MIIMGIDPGSTRIGYGVIRANKNLELVDCGTIEIKRKESGQLILEGAKAIVRLVKKHKPNLIGIEKLYFMKNVKTGIEVAQARGALLLEIARLGVPVKELSPSEIKSSVTGYGLATKKGVAKMVLQILKLKELGGLDDMSDALAVAIATVFKGGVDTKNY